MKSMAPKPPSNTPAQKPAAKMAGAGGAAPKMGAGAGKPDMGRKVAPSMAPNMSKGPGVPKKPVKPAT